MKKGYIALQEEKSLEEEMKKGYIALQENRRVNEKGLH